MSAAGDRSSAASETGTTGPALDVEIIAEDGDWSAFEPCGAAIAAAAQALARRLGLEGATAVIALSSDGHVRALNKQFRSKDAATNVLSFPAPPQVRAAPRALGDIVLAAETVRREAAELAIPPRHHLQHLVVHGLLHLLGHDHASDAEAEAMEAIEIEVLATLGVANPYLEPDAVSQPAAVRGGNKRTTR